MSSFKYVFIPTDTSKPVETRIASKSGGLVNDELVLRAKEYFFEAYNGGAAKLEALESASPAQRKALADQTRKQAGNSARVQAMTDDQLIEIVKSTETAPNCDILTLTVPTKGNSYQAASMYVPQDLDFDSATVELNTRATALLQSCGHQAPQHEGAKQLGVHGDVFVGRAYDNEEDEWLRMDFTPEEVEGNANWIAIARAKGGGGGTGGASASGAHSLSSVMKKMGQAQVADGGGADSAAQQQQENDLGYSWNQTDDEVEIKFDVPAETKAKDVKVNFGKEKIKITVSGELLAEGPTGGKLMIDDCTYTLQDDKGGRELCIVLGKQAEGVIWPCAIGK
jgi:hypothetical protein